MQLDDILYALVFRKYTLLIIRGNMFMRQEDRQAINEIRDMIKVLIEENERLANTINELKEEQKKLQEEIKIQNIVLNSLPFRHEILN